MKKAFTILIAAVGLFSCSHSNTEEERTEKKAISTTSDTTEINSTNQAQPDNGIEYEVLTEDPFAAYENAKLIIDYYVSDGWSNIERHSYEIMVIDNQIVFKFSSPQTESLREVRYEKKVALSPADVKEIVSLLKSVDIKQTRAGIPTPDASASKKEVLLIKNDSQHIVGGMFSYVIYEEGTSQEEIDNKIASTRRTTATISGNYDLLFDNLKNRFTNLDSLISASVQ